MTSRGNCQSSVSFCESCGELLHETCVHNQEVERLRAGRLERRSEDVVVGFSDVSSDSSPDSSGYDGSDFDGERSDGRVCRHRRRQVYTPHSFVSYLLAVSESTCATSFGGEEAQSAKDAQLVALQKVFRNIEGADRQEGTYGTLINLDQMTQLSAEDRSKLLDFRCWRKQNIFDSVLLSEFVRLGEQTPWYTFQYDLECIYQYESAQDVERLAASVSQSIVVLNVLVSLLELRVDSQQSTRSNPVSPSLLILWLLLAFGRSGKQNWNRLRNETSMAMDGAAVGDLSLTDDRLDEIPSTAHVEEKIIHLLALIKTFFLRHQKQQRDLPSADKNIDVDNAHIAQINSSSSSTGFAGPAGTADRVSAEVQVIPPAESGVGVGEIEDERSPVSGSEADGSGLEKKSLSERIFLELLQLDALDDVCYDLRGQDRFDPPQQRRKWKADESLDIYDLILRSLVLAPLQHIDGVKLPHFLKIAEQAAARHVVTWLLREIMLSSVVEIGDVLSPEARIGILPLVTNHDVARNLLSSISSNEWLNFAELRELEQSAHLQFEGQDEHQDLLLIQVFAETCRIPSYFEHVLQNAVQSVDHLLAALRAQARHNESWEYALRKILHKNIMLPFVRFLVSTSADDRTEVGDE